MEAAPKPQARMDCGHESMTPLSPWRRQAQVDLGTWNGSALSWLREEGSITARLRQANPDLTVMVLREGLLPIRSDEAQGLGVEPTTTCWVREVLLHQLDKRLVHARTVIPDWGPQNPWQALQGLGQRPLGEVLFQLPDVARSALEFAVMAPVAPQPWAATLQPRPARRRLHRQQHAALLLTEVFDFLAPGPNPQARVQLFSRVGSGAVL